MPYRIFWEQEGLRWHFFGPVDAREIAAAKDDFYRDPRCDVCRYQIIDTLQIESIEWAERDIQFAAALDLGASRSIHGVLVAFVADDPEVTRKFERYIEVSRRLGSNWRFGGFRTVDEARGWIAAHLHAEDDQPDR